MTNNNHNINDNFLETDYGDQPISIEQLEKNYKKSQTEWKKTCGQLQKEIERLRQSKKSSQEIYEMSVEMMQNLRSVEVRLHDIKHTKAWSLGTRMCAVFRKLRSSLPGKLYLLLRATVRFQLKSHLSVRQQMRIAHDSGLFDSEYYIRTYPLIEHSIWTPLEHYILHGEREGRQPNSIFRPYYYSQEISNENNKWGSPLVHYIKVGAEKNYDPSTLFSTKHYREKHSTDGENPLAHYLRTTANTTQIIEGDVEEVLTDDQSVVEEDAVQDENDTEENIENKNDIISPNNNNRIQTEIASLMNEISSMSIEEKLAKIHFTSNNNPHVSILIPFYNKLEYTVNCLYALHKQEYTNFEIILIDDNSQTEDCSALDSIKGIKIIKNKTNLGYLLSCNLAASKSTGPFIVQLNNDTLPLEGWLEHLLESFNYFPDAAVAGSMMLDSDGLIQEAGGVIFNDASGYNYGRGENPDEDKFNYCREVDYCSGASIIIKRDVWETIGGYDTLFAPAYYEDTDFAAQAKKKGYKVIYNPFSKIIHHEGVSSGTDTSSGIKRYQEINKDKFFQKWQKELTAKPPTPAQEELDEYIRDSSSKRGWILWLDSTTPTPDRDSGSIDTVNFFDQAIADNWGITFMPWDEVRHDGNYTKSLQYRGVACITGPSPEPGTCLLDLEDHYDIVVLSRVTVAKYAYPTIRRLFPKAKIIFNTVDLHFLRHQREAEHVDKNNFRELENEKQDELNLVKKCDATIVVSEAENRLLKKILPDAKIAVIPLFRDVPGRNNSFQERLNIGFIGGYQHPPNVDAVKYFVKQIWPIVCKKLNNCQLILAGSNVTQEILELANTNIKVRGYIPNESDLLEEVKVMIAPIRFGAGLKGKVVSGLCHGVPQVVTETAAEGMGLQHEVNAMIANDVNEFANNIIKLYQDPELWNEISKNAVLKAENSFSKRFVSSNITNLLNEMS